MGVKRHIKLDEDLRAFVETRMIDQENYLLRLERQLNELHRKVIMARAEIIGLRAIELDRAVELVDDNDE